MSGCDTPIGWTLLGSPATGDAPGYLYINKDVVLKPGEESIRPITDEELRAAWRAGQLVVKGCDCDHGEDDPCCTETDQPEEPPDEEA